MLRAFVEAMRPRQWPKNAFVFAGIFFDGRILDGARLFRSIAAFAIFCLVSSAIYLINDLADMEQDRLHPSKRNRPLASGRLAPRTASIGAAVLLVGGLGAAFAIQPAFGMVALLYAAIMVLYSFWLKHVVIIDVMTLAAGFVLRVFAGTTVVQVTRFSPWLYVCTTLLALFITINKRRHELLLLADNANQHRASLEEYSIAFLDTMTSLVAATVLASYSFYTFSAPNLPKNHTMMLTIPYVLYGIFRYLYLVHVKNLGGAPEDIALGDKPLMLAIGLWALTAAVVLYAPALTGSR